MEVRGILQAIEMEATALTFLFAIAFFAIRICVAERRAVREKEEAFNSSSEQPLSNL